ncbi:MAG: 3-deoxy-7-phosphoheptulonate synthase [Blastocatellia bacterium]|nr:3-deoxy-7-phosphoheptulonate synthase [Blastocatellia bacterium]
MLITMHPQATQEEIKEVVKQIESIGFKPHLIPGAQRTAIGITGNTGTIDPVTFEYLPGVSDVIRVSKPYKLVSREVKPENTVVKVGSVSIGTDDLTIIAGPCSVETLEQTMAVAEVVHSCGIGLFRAGAYKPRTSPYAFQGLGLEALKILAEVRDRYGLQIVTEALDEKSLELVEKYADMIQIGARNMQNFSLLRQAGQTKKPVLLKRGMSATLEELLLAAEYILSEGNYQVVLCERGVRTFADHTRNTLDLSIVPSVHRLSHLPILVDPSHGTGRREKVIPMARAAVAVGADGVIVEVHCQPEKALSDGPQALLPDMLVDMVDQLRQIHAVIHKERSKTQKV